ncbi:MAG: glycosyltransferase family 4 protein [Candidatus Brocadiales bacterium]|nr:glycosyltransferase family 4 protein [Candidatus Brocadiales bacterium]
MNNILYVFDNLEFGGGERVFAQIINKLCRDKYKVTVACMPEGIFMERIKGSGASVKPIDMSSKFNFKVILQLANLIKEQRIDIVHSQGARADFFARLSAKLARVPVVISTVPMPVDGFDVNPIKKFIYIVLNKFSERFVDKFIVVSEALKDVMIERHKVDPQKVAMIYNGIEINEYRIDEAEKVIHGKLGLMEEIGLKSDVPVIGVIGRLVWQKGFEYFIEAIPGVLNKFKDAKFLVVGEGLLEEELKAVSKKLKIDDKISFTGFRRDIKEILATIDIFVIPSLLEGLPMILLEAMGMGKPIVATDIDGIKEVLENGKTGLLVPPRDTVALTDAIVNLLIYRDQAHQMGINARRVVEEKFGVDIMVEKVEDVYEDLLQLNPE